jgi:hypothetical protein
MKLTAATDADRQSHHEQRSYIIGLALLDGAGMAADGSDGRAY